jgi:hypothetical protein
MRRLGPGYIVAWNDAQLEILQSVFSLPKS